MSNNIGQYHTMSPSEEEPYHFTEEELQLLSPKEKLMLKERIQRAINERLKQV
ncbi:MAG: hypothetical protein ACI4BA_07410 [Prevotella sp.]